jgi:hypothetical protein
LGKTQKAPTGWTGTWRRSVLEIFSGVPFLTYRREGERRVCICHQKTTHQRRIRDFSSGRGQTFCYLNRINA